MGKRRAKRVACGLAAALLDNYLGVGQPGEDCYNHSKGWIPEDEDVLTEAIEELMDELSRRGGDVDLIGR